MECARSRRLTSISPWRRPSWQPVFSRLPRLVLGCVLRMMQPVRTNPVLSRRGRRRPSLLIHERGACRGNRNQGPAADYRKGRGLRQREVLRQRTQPSVVGPGSKACWQGRLHAEGKEKGQNPLPSNVAPFHSPCAFDAEKATLRVPLHLRQGNLVVPVLFSLAAILPCACVARSVRVGWLRVMRFSWEMAASGPQATSIEKGVLLVQAAAELPSTRAGRWMLAPCLFEDTAG